MSLKPSLFKVTTIGTSELYIMPKPNSDYLADDLSYLKQHNIEVLVCLLEFSEIHELKLDEESIIAKQLGMEYLHFAIKDRSTPTLLKLKNFIINLNQYIKQSKNIVVHCRAGIGRSGLIACCLLIANGYSADDAMTIVSSARGIPIPDTAEQIDLIYDFEADYLANGGKVH